MGTEGTAHTIIERDEELERFLKRVREAQNPLVKAREMIAKWLKS